MARVATVCAHDVKVGDLWGSEGTTVFGIAKCPGEGWVELIAGPPGSSLVAPPDHPITQRFDFCDQVRVIRR